MSLSLEAAIRTCKVETGWANKVESDRFLNPNNMVCPIWNGVDTAGRSVCPDSFYTKNAGCNSASDRVIVENNVSRPQYMEYITLSSNGINGNIYGNTMGYQNSKLRTDAIGQIPQVTGNFGLDFGANVIPSCGTTPYREAMSQEAQQMRQEQAMQNGFEGYSFRKYHDAGITEGYSAGMNYGFDKYSYRR